MFYFEIKYGYWAEAGLCNCMLSGGERLNCKYHTTQLVALTRGIDH